jgi:cobalamin biosynthesis protein CobD/CbiB
MIKLAGIGIAWLGILILLISDAVQNQIVTTMGGVLVVALPALFLYLTQRLNRVVKIVEAGHEETKAGIKDIADKVDGLSSRREEQLTDAKVDAAAKGGELKAHEEQRSDIKEAKRP